MLKKLSLFVIGVLMGAVVFTSPASAGGHDDLHKRVIESTVDKAKGDALEQFAKDTGTHMSLITTDVSTSCSACQGVVDGEGSYEFGEVAICESTVVDSEYGTSAYVSSYVTHWVDYGDSSYGWYAWIDPSEMLVTKKTIEVPSWGIVCSVDKHAESGSYTYTGNSRWGQNYSRYRTRGTASAATMEGMYFELGSPDVRRTDYKSRSSSGCVLDENGNSNGCGSKG